MMRASVSQSVSRSVCLSRGWAVQKMAERIDILFGVETPGDPRNILLNEDQHSHTARENGFDAAFAKLLCPLVLSM